MGYSAGTQAARWRTRKWLALPLSTVLALGLLTSASSKAAPASYSWASALPGCHPSQPAVAHFSPDALLDEQPTDGPVPCGMPTGYPTVENRIEVTNNGTLIYQPALVPATDPPLAGGCGHLPGLCNYNQLARSADDGATWGLTHAAVEENPEGKFLGGDVDNNLYMDHASGRLFYYDYSSGTEGGPGVCANGRGATIHHSDDDGATWSHGFDLEHNCSENPTLSVGKATVSTTTWPGGVVYLCGNNFGTGIGGAGSTGKICSKSLDGGVTWIAKATEGGGHQSEYSGQAKDRLDPYPECAGAASSAGNEVQALSDGTLVVVVSCGETYLAQSIDEGATWSIRNQIPSGGSLRVDSHDNFYKLNGTLLSASHDGVNWTDEHDMQRPGLASRDTTFFAQGLRVAGHHVGDVAVMYYGTLEGHSTADGFITETQDAFSAHPLFWTGQVNEGRPLLTNGPGVNIGVTVLDFIGGAFSPDGRSVWASFVQDCGDNLVTDPNCSKRLPGTNPGIPQDGFAGRLVWPPTG